MTALIAWRNVWRNKIRSLILIGAIAFGLWGALAFMGFSRGMMDQMVETPIQTYLTHIQIHRPGFRSNPEVHKTIPSGPAVLKKVRNMAKIKATAGRQVARGMATSPTSSSGVRINGIKPRASRRVTSLAATMETGTYFNSRVRNPILIGRELADRLELAVGSRMVLNLQDADGELTAGAFRVGGIFNTGITSFDETNVFVRQKELGPLLKLEKKFHELAIYLKDSRQLKTVAGRLREKYPELEVATWKELSPALRYVVESGAMMLYIFLGIILLALGFSIVNTMLMAVVDRYREIGMLSAIGMSPGRLAGMIVLESLYISVTGGLTGLGLGFLTNFWLGKVGIDLSIIARGLARFGLQPVIYPHLPIDFYGWTLILVVVMAVSSALYPAWRALRMAPARALRTF